MRTLAAFALLFVLAGCGDDDGSAGSSEPRPLVDPASKSNPYPDSKIGLDQLLRDLLAAVKSGDTSRVAEMVSGLALSEPEGWFGATFGGSSGAVLASDYREASARIHQLAVLLGELVAADQTEVTVERFDRADDPAAVGYQALALAKMDQPVALYSVRLCTPGRAHGFHLWSFVYQSGSFRWVGKMKPLRDGPAPADDEIDPLERRQRERRHREGEHPDGP